MTTASTTAGARTENEGSSGYRKGLSTSSKAGLGVGIALAALLLIILGWYIRVKRRRTSRQQDLRDGSGECVSTSDFGVPIDESKFEVPRQCRDGINSEVSESESSCNAIRVSELQGAVHVAELEAR